MAVRTRRVDRVRRPLFTRDDAWFLIDLPVLFLAVTLVPERYWQYVCFRVEKLKAALGRFSPSGVLQGLTLMRGDRFRRDDAFRVAAMRSEHHLQVVREFFWGWRAPIEMTGAEHVAEALSKGHGAVVWAGHFSFTPLAAKKAFRAANYQLWQLSRPEHGFSKSRFGIAVLNPIRCRVENRYLQGRITINRANLAAGVHRAQRLLRSNQIVAITAGSWEGARVATVEIEGCRLDLATGAPGLARLTGATLLPVFTVRHQGSLAISVVIDEPIPVGSATDKDAALSAASQAFADRMARFVSTHPLQWRDWAKIRSVSDRQGDARTI